MNDIIVVSEYSNPYAILLFTHMHTVTHLHLTSSSSHHLLRTGIMDMMKDMYEDGDENMKKIIGEAMLKSQRGEKAAAPDMSEY